MPTIVPKVRHSVKQRLLRNLRRCRQAGLRLRYLIVVNLLGGRGAYQTAEALGVHNTTVYRVARRFRERGEWGLLDGREDNGAAKFDGPYLAALYRAVRSSPQRHSSRKYLYFARVMGPSPSVTLRLRNSAGYCNSQPPLWSFECSGRQDLGFAALGSSHARSRARQATVSPGISVLGGRGRPYGGPFGGGVASPPRQLWRQSRGKSDSSASTPLSRASRQFAGSLPLTAGPDRKTRLPARWTASTCAAVGTKRM